MAIGDPFSTTYEGARQGVGAFGQALQQTAQSFAERKQKEREMQMKHEQDLGLEEEKAKLKQLYPDPLTALIMNQMGLGSASTGGLPKTAKEAQEKAASEMGGKSDEYIPKPIYETIKGIKRISGYEAEQDPNALKLKLEAQKNLQAYTSSAHDVLFALEKVEEKAKKLPEFKTGLPGQLLAGLQVGVGEVSASPAFTDYESALNSELIPLARKLQEEKGPITEWDVSRVEKGLGRKTLPFDQKQNILNESKKKVYSALRNKMDAAGLPEKDFAAKYKTLWEKSRGLGRYVKIGKDEDTGERVGLLPDGTEELLYGN